MLHMPNYAEQLRNYFFSHITDYPNFQGSSVVYRNTALFRTVNTFETTLTLSADTVRSITYKRAVKLTIEDPYQLPRRMDGSDEGRDMSRGDVIRLSDDRGAYIQGWEIAESNILPFLERIFPFGESLQRKREADESYKRNHIAERKAEAASRLQRQQRIPSIVDPAIQLFFTDLSTRLSTEAPGELNAEFLNMILTYIATNLTLSKLKAPFIARGIPIRSNFAELHQLKSIDSRLDTYLKTIQ